MKNYIKKETNTLGTFYYNDLHQFHRLDGPALETPSGYKAWYINGKRYTKRKFDTHPNLLKYKRLQEAKMMLGLVKDERRSLWKTVKSLLKRSVQELRKILPS